MDDLRLQSIYNAASDHEPNKDELAVIDFLCNREYNDQNEAIVIAFLVGRLAGDIFRNK